MRKLPDSRPCGGIYIPLQYDIEACIRHALIYMAMKVRILKLLTISTTAALLSACNITR